MSDKYKILFVCLGNICRSPAAEGIFRQMAEKRGLGERLEADSAGTYAGHTGEQPDSRMRNAAYARGYLLTHRARQVRLRDFEEFDRIVAMDDTNYHNLYRLAPSREAGNRIYRMSEFFREHPKWTHVPDPYYEGHEGFELVLDMLEDGCRTLLCMVSDPDAETAAARCSTSWRRGSSKSQRTKKSAFFNALFFVESSLYAGAIRNIWSVGRPNQK